MALLLLRPRAVSERRRAEIQEKRARLAALKQAREDREAAQRASVAQSVASSTSGLPTPSSSTSRTASLAGLGGGNDRPGSRSSLGASTASRNDEIERLLSGVGVGRDRESTVRAADDGALRRSTASSIGVGASVANSTAGDSEEPPSSAAQSPNVEVQQEGLLPAGTSAGEASSPSSALPPPVPTVSPPTSSVAIETQAPPIPLPLPLKVTYDKSIQTSDLPSSSLPSGSSTQTDPSSSSSALTTDSSAAGRETAEELRTRILAELEAERKQLDAEIAAEKALAEQQLEAERARGLPPTQLSSVFSSPSFVDFLESSTKIVQRALSDSYDYLRDYTVTEGDGSEERDRKQRVRLVGSWQDGQWGRGRSVTGVDWSPKFPELFVASYNKNPIAVNEPDGIAAVWNLHLLERPEFVFHAQSDILSISFSPFHPNLVVGGSYSGQILLWDTRSRHPNPVLKTPLSSTGHTHPVYSLSLVGTQNAHSLVSASTDGTVCAWTLDMLARPQETLELLHPSHTKTDEVSITSLGFPLGETTTFWVGTEEGNVYPSHRYDRAGAKAGLVHGEVYRGHSGPVTAIDFHPVEGNVDLSDLFLTSGVDWTVKLWRAGGAAGSASSSAPAGAASSSSGVAGKSSSSRDKAAGSAGAGGAGSIPPLMSFEEADDYVYDVKWHPHHPAVFGSVDGAGKFEVWNLNVDTEVPIVSTPVGASRKGLNKLAWDKKDGRRAAIGSSDGKVYVYELAQELAIPRADEWEQMRKTVNSALSGLDGSR
ncbi:hypothetical protein JCM8547_009240 [Rhodosporidiobolus lusitaniae]